MNVHRKSKMCYQGAGLLPVGELLKLLSFSNWRRAYRLWRLFCSRSVHNILSYVDLNMSTRTVTKTKPSALSNVIIIIVIIDGNLIAAIRIMCSEDNTAPSSDNVYAQLLDKHPAPSSERSPSQTRSQRQLFR